MYREFLDFIFPLAEGAGKIQLAYFRGDDLAIRTKSNVYDVVTRADKESEAYIAAAILERWPDHEILGEEGGSMGCAGSDWRWVVDPLDGTTNYSQGLPVFSVSIALQYRGETIAGVVFAPYLNELFWASKGGGAYMKSRSGEVKRLHVSAKQTLATSVIATGFPYDKDVNPDNNAVEPADRISRQRTHDHRADEHRNIAADDHADGGNGADHPAPLPGDVAPCGVGDQQRQEVGQHRPDQLCELSVGPPSLRDEKRGDESPRDERADIGHDHAAQGPAELLDLLSHNFVSCLYIQAKRDYHLFETEKNGALFIKKPSSTGGRSYKTERTAAICRNWRRYNRRA